ncbi:MAG: hypothetical protein VKJ24_02225 [Synechococcales bacterium]|nr:hypothetical protein [Synechococcales bacterium]
MYLTLAGLLATWVIDPSAAFAQLTTSQSAPAKLTVVNQATADYISASQPQCSGDPKACPAGVQIPVQGVVSAAIATDIPRGLIDPLGQITGCAGELLPDYEGVSVAVYEADPTDPSGAGLRGLVPLTETEVPNNPNNTIPAGLAPNRINSNPFYLTNSDRGLYNFLLDDNRGQLANGRAYILVVNPKAGSIYSQRRIRIVLGNRNGDILEYTATSLDGKPLSSTDNRTSLTSQLQIQNAAQTGLVLSVFSLRTSICQAQEIQIQKTGDRAAAEPGDTVIYRLNVRNLSNASINNVQITDKLPAGIRLQVNSARASFKGVTVPILTTQQGSTVQFTFPGLTLPPAAGPNSSSEPITIAYAGLVTPDAIRGNGENLASVIANRSDNQRPVEDGPALHRLRIRAGITSDCGTLMGRVFVDRNFDGEQQPGEPGIPNAVIFLDDGNRVLTDANGLFSVANMLPGHRSGVLDLSSLPGYTLAPNLKFIERNSQSRIVHLAPGGMARMNFAVTPTFKEVGR